MPTAPLFSREKDKELETTTKPGLQNSAKEAREGRIRGYFRDTQGENNEFFREARERNNPNIAHLRKSAEAAKKGGGVVETMAADLMEKRADQLAQVEMRGYKEPDSAKDKRARTIKDKLVAARKKRGLSPDGKVLAPSAPAAPAAPKAPPMPKVAAVGELSDEELEKERDSLLYQ